MAMMWPFRFLGICRRWRRLKVTPWLLVAALVLSLNVFRPTAWTTLLVPRCRHSFLLSESVFPWEQHSSEATRSCDTRDKDYRECVQARLRRTKAALGHTPCLAIIGDSRGRLLYVNMINATGPTKPVWGWAPNASNETEAKVEPILFSPGMKPEEFCARRMCSSNATNDFIEFQYFWRPFMDRHLSETLRTFATECATRRRQCPDTVLVNGGLWYTGRVRFMFHFNQHVQLLMFRQGLLQLASPLAELARRTRTIWKLEEAMLFEFVQDKHEPDLTKTDYMQLVMVQHALVYELKLQVPDLVVWSSLLPEVTRHMFHVCAPEQPRRWSECPDAMHMGRTLQDGFCDLLLSDLSDRALSRATSR